MSSIRRCAAPMALLAFALLPSCHKKSGGEKVDGPPPPSLSSLVFSLGTLSPPFSPALMTYQLALAPASTAVTATPTAADVSFTIKVKGVTVVSGSPSGSIPTPLGSLTVIDVAVSDAAGSATVTYTVNALRLGPQGQEAYVKAANAEMDDYFGWSVAISGDTMVVGAPNEDSNAVDVGGLQGDNSAADSGAAYVFFRTGTAWAPQGYLKASNTAGSAKFGTSVAISGDTIVVGAPYESGVGSFAGAAYVFFRTGTAWAPQAYLKAANAEANDHFGSSVAISGDTIVVGAPGEDSNATVIDGNGANNSASAAGAAYVFFRTGTAWSAPTYLKPSNAEAGDEFGTSVAISGDTIVVGAPKEDSNSVLVGGNAADNSAADAGAAYVFLRTAGVWAPDAYLKATNTEAGDKFGSSVAISGDTIVVGAPGEGSNATGVDGDGGNNAAGGSGAAYVYPRSAGSWIGSITYLKATNTGGGDQFGSSVGVSGNTIVVGAFGESGNSTGVNNPDNNLALAAGAAYVFATDGFTWMAGAYLKASNTEANDYFGGAVAISGDTIVSTSLFEDSNATTINGNESNNLASAAGAVYVLR